MRSPVTTFVRWQLTCLAMITVGAVAGCDGAASGDVDSESQTGALAEAREVLSRFPVFDGHNDLAWAIRRAERPLDVAAYDLYERAPGHTDIPRLETGLVGAQFWSVYIPGEIADSGFARVQLEQVDVARQFIDMYPEFQLTATASEVETAMAAGRIASMLGLEGGHAIENSISALRIYFDLGVRYMTLTHNVTLDWADAASDEARHGGLTGFGEEVVGEMNRLGMLVDLSHVSPATMSDALDVSLAPVIFSHSSARALTDHVRNVPDSILARLPDNGGVVMVTFVTSFVSEPLRRWGVARDSLRQAARSRGATEAEVEEVTAEFEASTARPVATVSDVADHIEHVRAVAGLDHVGIGADYDGISTTPEGLDDVSAYPILINELLERGWSESEIGQLTNGNILRVLRQAEEVAQRLKIETAPSAARLDDR